MPLSPSYPVSRQAVLALWCLALLPLLAGLGDGVVQRTQEARVLETAREMLVSTGAGQWLVPQMNGEVRMNKPPLAYWVTASSFRMFGVNEYAGRLPFALSAWLTLALVYRFGRRLIDQRFGLFSAAILLTSFMFFRHFRAAETDGLASLFVTASVYAFFSATRQTGWRSIAGFHLAAAAAALAGLAKGGPAVFPILFFIAWAAVERNWGALWRFVRSGAPIAAAVVVGPWLIAVRHSAHFHVLRDEIAVVTGGEDHVRSFTMYFPLLFVATAPWTGLFVLGLLSSVRSWRIDGTARVLLLWAAAVLLPLCLIGNKQVHYLVPITPPLAMLAAYALHRALSAASANLGEAVAARRVLLATLVVSALAPAGLLWFARHQRGFLQSTDLLLAIIILAAAIGAIAVARRDGLAAGAAAYAAGIVLVFAVTFSRWWPSLDTVNHRTVAADLRAAFGDRPYVFYGKDPSLPLVWNLRTIAPTLDSPDKLRQRLTEQPDVVVIAQTKNKRPPPLIPDNLKEVGRFETRDDGMTFQIYALPHSP